MLIDDTNLFFPQQNISTFFLNVNNELNKIEESFKANRLSLNIKKKKKYTFFQKNSLKDNIPLKLIK